MKNIAFMGLIALLLGGCMQPEPMFYPKQLKQSARGIATSLFAFKFNFKFKAKFLKFCDALLCEQSSVATPNVQWGRWGFGGGRGDAS